MKFRKQVRLYVRNMLKSIKECPDEWEEDGALLHSKSGIQIAIIPRRFRICDSIRVSKNGVDIWLPLCQRLKIRRAIRREMIKRASMAFPVCDKETCCGG